MQTIITFVLIILCIFFIQYCFKSKYELFTVLSIKDFEKAIIKIREDIHNLTKDDIKFNKSVKRVNYKIKHAYSRLLRNKCARTNFYLPSKNIEYNSQGLVYSPIVRTGRYNKNKCEYINGKLEPCKKQIKCLDEDLNLKVGKVRIEKQGNNVKCIYDKCKNRCNKIIKDCWKNENGLIRLYDRYEECDNPIDNSDCKKLNDPSICLEKYDTNGNLMNSAITFTKVDNVYECVYLPGNGNSGNGNNYNIS